MATVIISLQGLTANQQIERGVLVSGGLTGNANVPDGDALAAAITAETDQATVDLQAQKTAQEVAENATRTLSATLKRLGMAYANGGNKVQAATEGDPEKIATTFYEVRKTPGASREMPKVTGFGISMGDEAGEVDSHWDSVAGVQSYATQFYLGAEVPTAAQWQNGPPLGRKSKTTQTGLPSGARFWQRVCAIGALGTGPWSDPAYTTVP